MQDTRPLLLASDFPGILRSSLDTVQVNLGYLCNLSCVHCHVNAGPSRTELMDRATVDQVLALLDTSGAQTLDLTGGAPEMNPHFRYLVEQARARGVRVIDRCNLTVIFEPGQESLAEFLAQHEVEVTASLPCYTQGNVEEQRGKGVYHDSIRALQQLNALGYGKDPTLQLNLVYNPVGAVLPPPQEALQADYQRELKNQHGIVFNQLFTITNMPISRFGAVLLAQNQYYEYMTLLRDSFSQHNLDTVMCRSMLSIDWQGYLYDCDFNQMLELPMIATTADSMSECRADREPSQKRHLSDLLQDFELRGLPIATGEHCYGCTAGQGSSCGGALEAG